jgi:hypothetical protein
MEKPKPQQPALFDPRQAEALRSKERRRSKKNAKEEQLKREAECELKNAEKEAQATRLALKTRKSEANRRAYNQRSYNAKDRTCRHCGQHGHDDYNAVTSCPLFCRYCEQCGHAFATCVARTKDAIVNAATNADAQQYKVRRTKVHNDIRDNIAV